MFWHSKVTWIHTLLRWIWVSWGHTTMKSWNKTVAMQLLSTTRKYTALDHLMRTEKNLCSRGSSVYQVPESVLIHHSQDSTLITVVVTGLLMGYVYSQPLSSAVWFWQRSTSKLSGVIWGIVPGTPIRKKQHLPPAPPKLVRGRSRMPSAPTPRYRYSSEWTSVLLEETPCRRKKTWARHTVQPRWDGCLQRDHGSDEYKDAEGNYKCCNQQVSWQSIAIFACTTLTV